MKTNYLIIILIVLLFGSCNNKKQVFVPPPFKPALELAITELIDSLKEEIGDGQLLSIYFHYPTDIKNYDDQDFYYMKAYVLDGYASAYIVGCTSIGNTTIAIYNLKDDILELVNKNEITFFTDTILGFKDICFLNLTGKEQYLYKIITEDSVTKVSNSMSFLLSNEIRPPKCPDVVSVKIPKEHLFYYDSLQAEENLKRYQKEVEYYRDKKNAPQFNGK